MKSVNIHEAKTHLSRLLEHVAAGRPRGSVQEEDVVRFRSLARSNGLSALAHE